MHLQAKSPCAQEHPQTQPQQDHAACPAADNPAEAIERQHVDVIGTTPLPGLGTPLRDVPSNVQVFGSKDIQRQKQSNLSEFLEQNPTSVTVNAIPATLSQLPDGRVRLDYWNGRPDGVDVLLKARRRVATP